MCQHNTIQLTLDAVIGYKPAFQLCRFFRRVLGHLHLSVPPASCLGLNKATDYAVTRPQVPPPAPKNSSPWLRSNLFLAAVGTPRTAHSHPLAIAFPVGAQQQHCCALARQAASSAAVTLLPWDCRTAFLFIDLQPLGISCLSFSHPDPLFSMICSLFCQNTGGGVPLQLLRAP